MGALSNDNNHPIPTKDTTTAVLSFLRARSAYTEPASTAGHAASECLCNAWNGRDLDFPPDQPSIETAKQLKGLDAPPLHASSQKGSPITTTTALGFGHYRRRGGTCRPGAQSRT